MRDVVDVALSMLRQRRRVVPVAVCLCLVACVGLSRLQVDFDPRALVDGGAELPRTLIAVVDVGSPLDVESLQRIHDVSDAWTNQDGVRRVDSITHTPLPVAEGEESDASFEALIALIEAAPESFPDGLAGVGRRTGGPLTLRPLGTSPRAIELAPRLQGGLIGRSGRTAIVVATLDHQVDAQALADAVEGEGVRVTGLPLLEADVEAELRDDPITILLWAMLGNLLVLAWGFRRAAGIVLPLAAAGITVLIVMGTLSWLGVTFSLLDVILPSLLLTLGISDAVHLVSRDGEERRIHPPEVAARHTMSVMAKACLATSVTTALGFGSLMLAGAPAVRRFGLLAVVGVFVAFAVTVVIVPALLPGFASKPPRRIELRGLGRLLLARPAWILGGAAALACVAGMAATDIRTGTRLLEPFGDDHPRTQTTLVLEHEHGGIRELEIHVDEASVESMATWLRSRPEVLRIENIETLDAIWQHLAEGPRPPGVLDELVDIAAAAGRPVALSPLSVGIPDLRTHEVLALADEVRARGGRVEGEAWTTTLGLRDLTQDLVYGFGIALVLIVLLLSLLLRSVRLGLLSLPPNLLPLLLVGAWMGVRDIPLTASTALVFAISFGLVVDGTIHLFMRFREERDTWDRREAALQTLRHSGRAVVLGGLTLAAGFAPILGADFAPLQLFAELSMVAIVSAIIAELVLTPVLLARFAR